MCKCCRTTASLNYIRKLTRLRVVDNSNIGRAAELAGKPAKCIHIYNKKGYGYLGDKVLSDFSISCVWHLVLSMPRLVAKSAS